MSEKKDKKQKKERSKKDWKARAAFLKDLKAWWLEVYPKPERAIKGYVTRLNKKIKEANEKSN